MSRHHHRFERDYRGPWDRRDIRPSGLHNGGANHSCASAVVNGNNRPGLLPLPVIPSLLPTPVTVAVTTSSGDIAVKRGITAAGSVAPASAKVTVPSNSRIQHLFPFFVSSFANFLNSEDFPTGHNRQLHSGFPASFSVSPSFSYPLSHFVKVSVLFLGSSSLIHSLLSLSLMPPVTLIPRCSSAALSVQCPILAKTISFHLHFLSLPNGRILPSLPP